MRKQVKKLYAIIVAVSMVLSFCVYACAEEPISNGNESSAETMQNEDIDNSSKSGDNDVDEDAIPEQKIEEKENVEDNIGKDATDGKDEIDEKNEIDEEEKESTDDIETYMSESGEQSFDVTSAEFGANGNDTTLDADAIQAALNKAQGSNTKIVVNIPSGKYYIDKPLYIYSNTDLKLNDAEIIRTNDGGNYKQPMLYNPEESKTHDITIEGGVWNGGESLSGLEDTAALICIEKASKVKLLSTRLKNVCGTHMVVFDAVSDLTVDSVVFSDYFYYEGNGSDYYAWKNEDGTPITDTNERKRAFYSQEALHIDFAYDNEKKEELAFQNVTVTGCEFYKMASGIGTHNQYSGLYATNVVIENNVFYDIMFSCINAYNFSEMKVTDNKVKTHRGAEYDFGEGAGSFLNSQGSSGEISNNKNISTYSDLTKTQYSDRYPDDEAFDVIVLRGNSTVQVNNNTISGGTGNGIFMDSSNAVLSDNGINDSGKSGVYASKTSNLTLAGGNKIENAGINGISADQTTTLTTKKSNAAVNGDNEIKGSKQNGIYIAGSTFNLSGDKVDSNVENGIIVDNNSKGTIEKETVSSSGKSGIVVHSSSEAIVKDNEIMDTKTYGINVNNPSGISVTDNTISNTDIFGIYFSTVQLGSNNKERGNIERNHISDSKNHGLCLYITSGISANNNIIETNDGSGIEVCGEDLGQAPDEDKIKNSKKCSDIELSLNEVKNNDKYGIHLYNVDDIRAENNDIEENIINGIASSYGTNIKVSYNTVLNNGLKTDGGTDLSFYNKSSGEAKYNRIASAQSIYISTDSQFEKEGDNNFQQIDLTKQVGWTDTAAQGSKCTYVSSNPNVVSVSSVGKMLALKAGDAKIYALDKEKKAVYSWKFSIKDNGRVLLNRQIGWTDTAGQGSSVSYTSTNPDVVSVTNMGKMTALKNGKAYVYAWNEKNELVYSWGFTIQDYPQVVLTKIVGWTDTAAQGSSATYSSTNTDIVSVSNQGKMTALKEGSAIVYAKNSAGIIIYSWKFTICKQVVLTKTVGWTDTAAQGNSAIYSSTNADIVSVSNQGKMTALKKGTATITAKDKNGNLVYSWKFTINDFGRVILTKKVGWSDTAGQGSTVTYTSTNPAAVSVTEKGEITAIDTGEAYVYAWDKTGEFNYSWKFTITK